MTLLNIQQLKHTKTFLLSATLVVAILFSQGCKRTDIGFDGPSLEDINGEFKMVSPFASSLKSADFSKGENIGFSAEFSKQCDWEIVIRGLMSGATKYITGKSKIISSTETIWNGSTTNFPMFRTEPCLATLKIKNVTDTFNLNLGINGLRNPSGLMIADFEMGMNSKWTTFIQSGANMDFKIHNDAFKVQGNNYLNMAGTVNWDWLIGLVDFNATALGSPKFQVSNIAEDVYFNCIIYGDPKAANQSRILFQFKEDDNGNNKFDAGSDDQFDKEIIVDWEGWKIVSFKYSDLIHLVNGAPATNNGNNRHNSNDIVTISMLHLANPSMGGASTKIDALIITEKSPAEF